MTTLTTKLGHHIDVGDILLCVDEHGALTPQRVVATTRVEVDRTSLLTFADGRVQVISHHANVVVLDT